MLAPRTFGMEARRGASTVIGEEKKRSLYFVLQPSPKEPEAGKALIRFLASPDARNEIVKSGMDPIAVAATHEGAKP